MAERAADLEHVEACDAAGVEVTEERTQKVLAARTLVRQIRRRAPCALALDEHPNDTLAVVGLVFPAVDREQTPIAGVDERVRRLAHGRPLGGDTPSPTLRADGEELVAEPAPEGRILERAYPAAAALAEQRRPLELDRFEAPREEPLEASCGQRRDMGRVVAEAPQVARPNGGASVVQSLHRVVRRREGEPTARPKYPSDLLETRRRRLRMLEDLDQRDQIERAVAKRELLRAC